MEGLAMLLVPDNRIVILALLFAAVLSATLGVSWLMRPRSAVQRRLAGGGDEKDREDPVDVVLRPRHRPASMRLLDRLFAAGPGKSRHALAERLGRAGFRRPEAVRNWQLARIGLSLLVPTVVLSTLVATNSNIGAPLTLLIAAACGGIAFLLPSIWLDRRASARTLAIRLAFPDALDMVLVCVEAGLGIDAALHRTTAEIGCAHPALAEEMALMTAELRAGKQRAEVLRDFAARSNVEEVRSFVTVIIYAEQFGTSIADAIRVYTGEMRSKRLLRAEEAANILPVKLSVVIAGCTFPALFLLLLTPMMISLIRALASAR